MKSIKLFAALGLFAAAVSSTATGAVLSQLYSPVGRYDDMLSTRGPIPVFVRGSPFANDPGNQGVVAALQRHTMTPNVKYVPSTSPNAQGYHVVLAFGGFVPGINYCDTSADFPVAMSAASGMRIAAVYCYGKQLRSQALVSGAAAGAPSDANFNDMMATLTAEW
jgi:hypothetical protein